MLMFDIAVVITVLGMNALSALCYSREKKRTGPVSYTHLEVTGYKVYIYYNGGAAEFWLWRENQWVNWSYMEQ